jgi:hypothetical protein
MHMKLYPIAAAGLFAFASLGAAIAQTVVIQPEQETIIREYVVREEVEPVTDVDFELTVGSIVPDTVEVRRLEVPEIEGEYEYVVIDDRTVLVEPGTRKIVHVID